MPDPPYDRPAGVSLQRALLALVAVAFLAGIVPAGLVLDRWVARELEARAREDIARAPGLLADRNAAVGDAMMMHAKELAHDPAVVEALGRDPGAARLAADRAARALKYRAVLVGADGEVLEGPDPSPALVEATRRGEMPVATVSDTAGLFMLSVAPVIRGGSWVGAAGVATPLDDAAAGALAGLTRSDLVLLLGGPGPPVASTAGAPGAAAVARAVAADPGPPGVREVRTGERRYLAATAPLGDATVAFARDLRRELAIVPRLRGVLAWTGAGALALALLLGAVLALALARPVRVLAQAADRLSRGDFGAPLVSSPVREVERVTRAFGAMRRSLAARIEELRGANRMLEERQARLTALQSELIRRERVAVSGRMAAELAHEIRNPVANLRNCLELLHRRLDGDAEGREFAALAIDELLRMHELAERMLHLNRPHDPALGGCDAARVAHEVAALSRIGSEPERVRVEVRAVGTPLASLPPDALKQVLLNLVQNARDARPRGLVLEVEAREEGETTVVTVADNGPGIPPELRARVFDPFFTTRSMAGGVGLGLFVVEGVVRAHGGTVAVEDRPGGGALFRMVLPAAGARDAEPAAPPVREEAAP